MKKWGLLGAVLTVVASAGFSFTYAVPQSESVDSDVIVNVNEVISLTIVGCNSSVVEDVKLTAAVLPNGSFSSCPLNAIVSTNAPGFKLSIQGIDTATYGTGPITNPYWDGANDGSMKLVRTYMKVTEQVDTTNTIIPHTGTISSPTAMTSATTSVWGFAIPLTQSDVNNSIGLTLNNFDSTYSTINQSDTTSTGRYAAMPTAVTQIKDYPNFSTTPNQTTVYFGTRVKAKQASGSYKGIVMFSATSNEVPPPPLTWKQISGGWRHTCAIASDSKAYCWGWGLFGQLGNGLTSDQTTPFAVSPGAMVTNFPSGFAVKQISVSTTHTCAIAGDPATNNNDKAYCWGEGDVGQLGNGLTSDQSTPVAVSPGVMATDFPSGYIIKQISSGYIHTCAIAGLASSSSTDKAYCWGSGGSGRLGNGLTTQQTTPVAVSPGAMATDFPSGFAIKQISASGTLSSEHTCAIAGNPITNNNDKAYCWGYGGNGQLGNGSTPSSQTTPVAVSPGAMATDFPSGYVIKQVSAGTVHTCVIAGVAGSNDTNKAYCWGYGGNGQLGNGLTTQQTTPVAVSPGAMATDFPSGYVLKHISSGQQHSCLVARNAASNIKADKAYCWGEGLVGQLGNGLTPATQTTPVAFSPGAMATDFPSGFNIKDISSGSYHNCVIASGNKAYCWGWNAFGQIGDGTSGTNRLVPTKVLNP